MAETIVLDSAGAISARTEVDITGWVDVEGVDWGDAAIDAYLSDQTFGSSPVSYRIPNRQIKIPLNLRAVGSVSFATIRSNLQQKVGLFQRSGGVIMRKVGTTPLYADIKNAALHLGGSWLQAYRDADVDAVLTLECAPDWYGDEVTLSDHTETSKPELIFVEPTIDGNYPARVRIAIDNDDATDWHGMLWGFRNANYDSAPTAALVYEAEALQVLDAGTITAHAGASGGTVIKHPSLPAGAWCPVLSTNIGGTAFLTHQGSYRVWARCYSAAAKPQMRFLWDVGDMTNPAMNDTVALPASGNWYMIDLGQIQLRPPAETPSSRWQGVIQAKATAQGDQIEIDRLSFQPLDDGGGRLTAVQRDSALGINLYRSAGTAVNDDAIASPRPSSDAWFTPMGVVADDYSSRASASPGYYGVYEWTQYLKSSGYGFNIPAGATISGVQAMIKKACLYEHTVDYAVRLVKAGTVNVATNKADTVTPWPYNFGYFYYGGPTDLWSTTLTPTDVNDPGFGLAISALNTSLVGSETIMVDYMRLTIFYTISGGFSTTPDAVVFKSHSAELRTAGMIRKDATGNADGPVSSVIGSLPRIPPSGLEAKPIEVFLKPTRGDFATEPDAGIDDISARILYRPCFLYTT